MLNEHEDYPCEEPEGFLHDDEDDADDCENWYFTFGYDSEQRNRYVKLRGTFASTREEMFHRFGTKWAFQYDEQTFLPQIERYGLTQIFLD